MKKKIKVKVFKQALKFGAVGIGNTLITLFIIWVMMKWLGYDKVDESMVYVYIAGFTISKKGLISAVSNFTGYAIGIIGSFIFNKTWTFKSSVGWKKSAIRFFLVFAICYVIQFVVLLILNRYFIENPPLYAFFSPLLHIFKIDPPFYNHMFAMVIYTLLNFLINKFYTFKA